MTWGQLRLQLQTAAPGVSLDLLDTFLNSRYEQVLGTTDWVGLKASGLVETTAAYQSGTTDTVTWTVGNATVTGVGTAFTGARVGQVMYRPGDTVTYTVATVGSGTSLTLDRPYEGVSGDPPGKTYPAAQYVFYVNLYTLPPDAVAVVEIIDPITGFTLQQFSKREMDDAAGTRTLVQDPVSFALQVDTSEATPPVQHQIEFYPPPLYARGFKLLYQRAAYAFDGTNTAAAPLPWVTGSVLLYGGRADVEAYLTGQQPSEANAHARLAQMYEAKFQEELGRMLRVEHQQRRKKVQIKMADRFTRHRLDRAARNMNNYWGRGQGGPY